jgi:hypothetical protein
LPLLTHDRHVPETPYPAARGQFTGADTLGVKPREVRSFLSGQVAAERTQELHDRLLAAGVPV